MRGGGRAAVGRGGRLATVGRLTGLEGAPTGSIVKTRTARAPGASHSASGRWKKEK